MVDDRLEGRVRAMGGKAEEATGKTAGDTKTQVEGLPNQATGTVEDAYEKSMDIAAEGVKTVKKAAIAGHDYLRKFMEDNPHTTTVIALGIGLLIGYAAHRQPSRSSWWG
jgi:uncharacterized protein YjbJ (UPF0337 family)